MRFFFYGTLLAGNGSPIAAAAHRKLGPGAAATVRGALHAIPDPAGWYPAFIPDADGGLVHGALHTALPQFGPDDLAMLDAYEHCDSPEPGGGEYRRVELAVEAGSEGRVLAQCYVYARGLAAAAKPVPGGDFRAFIEASGLPEYRDPD